MQKILKLCGIVVFYVFMYFHKQIYFILSVQILQFPFFESILCSCNFHCQNTSKVAQVSTFKVLWCPNIFLVNTVFKLREI